MPQKIFIKSIASGASSSILDAKAAREAMEDGISRAIAHANAMWKEAAFQCLCEVAGRQEIFTADEVWDLLHKKDVKLRTHNNSAMAAPFLWASKLNYIVNTGEMRQTERPTNHRKLTIWRSLIVVDMDVS